MAAVGGYLGRPEIESACISTGKALTGDRSCGGCIGYGGAPRDGILAERLQLLVRSTLAKKILLVHYVAQPGSDVAMCTIMDQVIALQQELD